MTKYRGKWRTASTLICLVTVVTLAVQCTPRSNDTSLPLDPPVAFSDSGVQEVPDRWWTVFEDPTLNRLVEEALRENFNLATAWQRLREAQAIAERQAALLFPELEGQAEAEKSRLDAIDTEQLRLGLASVYEVDLWGRIRSSVEARRYRAAASLADYQTAALSLAAEVVRTWYQLLETGSELALLDRQIETNTRILNLIINRFGSGQIRSVDILRQKQLLEATREQKILAQSRLQVLKHQLAVLLGRPPRDQIAYSMRELPGLPPLPDTGLPVELVNRRPDVRRAYSSLLAADRDMAAAVSNRYPRLTLSGSLATSDDNANALFEEWAYSVAGNLAAPLFDGGERRAEVDRTEALKMQRLYEYGQTILIAFQEVEDGLIREKQQVERIRSLQEQSDYARQTHAQLRVQYFNGVTDYIEVLVSLIEEQQLQRELLAARLLLLELRIGLYRALAGGFTTERESGDTSLHPAGPVWPDRTFSRTLAGPPPITSGGAS